MTTEAGQTRSSTFKKYMNFIIIIIIIIIIITISFEPKEKF